MNANPPTFFGEVGVERRMEHVWLRHWPDDDYGPDDPDGSEYGRRNYDESAYWSGTGNLSPGEYRRDGYDFYRDYHGTQEPRRPDRGSTGS